MRFAMSGRCLGARTVVFTPSIIRCHYVSLPRRYAHLPLSRGPGLGTQSLGYSATAAFLTSRRFQSAPALGNSDHYTTLGVSPDATQDEIKAAYKRLALEFHPDRNHESGAEERFKTISAAYNVIGHKDKRREYDVQRTMFSSPPSSSSGYSSGGVNSKGAYPREAGYQQMSKEDADRLFREIFGGMHVDEIFRGLEEEMRHGSIRAPGGPGSHVGYNFQHSEQAFRPFFSTAAESRRIFTDAHGNRMEEHTYVDPRGRRYTVRKTSSEDPNASMNQTPEDYNQSHYSRRDGRVHFGKVSSSFRQPENDFTKHFFGIRSHGRGPLMGIGVIIAWSIVLLTMLYSVGYLLFHHPFFCLAVLFLVAVGRRGRV